MWTYLFSNDSYGILNSFLINWGLISEPIQWLYDPDYNFFVVIVVVLWMGMGTGFLAFIAGFKQLNASYFEAAAIDGLRNRWQELWYITLPQMKPQLLFGAVILALCGVYLMRHGVISRRCLTALAVAAGIAVLAAGPVVLQWVLHSRMGEDIQDSNSDRLQFLARAVDDFLRHPVFGIGLCSTRNADVFSGVEGSMVFYHNSVAQVMGSMGLVGIVAYGRLLHDRIALLREGGRDPFVQALAVSYLGMVLISLCNPGEFCPFPNAAMMVMLFAQAEEAVGDVAVPVRQLLVRHLGAPAGFLQF